MDATIDGLRSSVPTALLGQQRVDVPVITSLELHDLLPTRGGSRQSEGTHRGFGTRVHEAHHLELGHEPLDQTSKLDLSGIGSAEAGAALGGFF